MEESGNLKMKRNVQKTHKNVCGQPIPEKRQNQDLDAHVGFVAHYGGRAHVRDQIRWVS